MRIRIAGVLLCIFLSSCIASWMDYYSGKYRKILEPGSSKELVRKTLGEPLKSYDQNEECSEGQYKVEAFRNTFYSCEIYYVQAKIHREGDGSAQATINAASVGAAEVILIPLTISKIKKESKEFHTLVIFYDASNRYLDHQIYDVNGNRESNFGY